MICVSLSKRMCVNVVRFVAFRAVLFNKAISYVQVIECWYEAERATRSESFV